MCLHDRPPQLTGPRGLPEGREGRVADSWPGCTKGPQTGAGPPMSVTATACRSRAADAATKSSRDATDERAITAPRARQLPVIRPGPLLAPPGWPASALVETMVTLGRNACEIGAPDGGLRSGVRALVRGKFASAFGCPTSTESGQMFEVVAGPRLHRAVPQVRRTSRTSRQTGTRMLSKPAAGLWAGPQSQRPRHPSRRRVHARRAHDDRALRVQPHMGHLCSCSCSGDIRMGHLCS